MFGQTAEAERGFARTSLRETLQRGLSQIFVVNALLTTTVEVSLPM